MWRKIGAGRFGDVYSGSHIQTGEAVAIKLEAINSKHPQLVYESKLLKTLAGGVGVPNVQWYGVEGEYNVMVMDLLGPSLEEYFRFCDRTISLKSVLMLADQMLSRIEYVHGNSLVHRDIKPENFLLGLGRQSNQVYIIDFGLAKKYRDLGSLEHVPFREVKNFSSIHSSINTYRGFEQSRRDDLEAIGHVLLYLNRGSLPWQGLKAFSKREKHQKMMDKMLSMPIEALCEHFPAEFVTYLDYTRNLGFEDEPDYAYLRRLLSDLFFGQGYQYDFAYEWTVLHCRSGESGSCSGAAAGEEA